MLTLAQQGRWEGFQIPGSSSLPPAPGLFLHLPRGHGFCRNPEVPSSWNLTQPFTTRFRK